MLKIKRRSTETVQQQAEEVITSVNGLDNAVHNYMHCHACKHVAMSWSTRDEKCRDSSISLELNSTRI